jgi:hypothetical protein
MNRHRGRAARRWYGVLALAAAAWETPPAPAGPAEVDRVAVRPREIGDPLPNPNMGWGLWAGPRFLDGRMFSLAYNTEGFGDDAPLFGWVLVDWMWSDLEPREGEYRWDELDAVIDYWSRRHKQFLVRLRNPVGTAVSSGGRPPGVLANDGNREPPSPYVAFARSPGILILDNHPRMRFLESAPRGRVSRGRDAGRNPREQEAIRLMRRGRARGKTDRDLVKMVEDLGIETKEGNRIWLPMTIQGILGRAVARYARIGHRRCHSGRGPIGLRVAHPPGDEARSREDRA